MNRVINEVENSLRINSFEYKIRNTLIVKSICKNIQIDNEIVKDGLRKFLRFFSYAWKFFLFVLFIGLSLFIIKDGFGDYFVGNYYNYYYIVLIFLAIGISTARPIFDFNENDYIFIKLLNINKKKYIDYKLKRYIIETCLMLVCDLLLIEFVGIFYTIIYTITYLSVRLICEYYHLLILKKVKKINIKSGIIKYVYFMLIISLVFYMFEILFAVFPIVINDFEVIVTTFILFGLCIYYLFFKIRKFNFNYLFNQYLREDIITIKRAKVSYQRIDRGISSEKIIRENDKKGYDFLYDVFNKKYSRSLIVKTILVPSMFLALIIGAYFEFPDIGIIDSKTMAMSFLIISSIMGEYLKLCYMNIDRYLNNYKFHKKNIKENIKQRVKVSIKYDLISCLLLILCFFFCRFSISEIIILVICLIIAKLYSLITTLYFYYTTEYFSYDGKKSNMIDIVITFCLYILIYFLSSFESLESTAVYIVYFILAIVTIVFNILLKKKCEVDYERN